MKIKLIKQLKWIAPVLASVAIVACGKDAPKDSLGNTSQSDADIAAARELQEMEVSLAKLKSLMPKPDDLAAQLPENFVFEDSKRPEELKKLKGLGVQEGQKIALSKAPTTLEPKPLAISPVELTDEDRQEALMQLPVKDLKGKKLVLTVTDVLKFNLLGDRDQHYIVQNHVIARVDEATPENAGKNFCNIFNKYDRNFTLNEKIENVYFLQRAEGGFALALNKESEVGFSCDNREDPEAPLTGEDIADIFKGIAEVSVEEIPAEEKSEEPKEETGELTARSSVLTSPASLVNEDVAPVNSAPAAAAPSVTKSDQGEWISSDAQPEGAVSAPKAVASAPKTTPKTETAAPRVEAIKPIEGKSFGAKLTPSLQPKLSLPVKNTAALQSSKSTEVKKPLLKELKTKVQKLNPIKKKAKLSNE